MALLLAMAVASGWVNRAFLHSPLYETMDLAANSLLVEDAKELRLLTGNYSRVGFNHPGPAILYALAAGDALFHGVLGWVASPIAGQLLAGHLYNASWAALLLWLLARMFGSVRIALAAATLFVAVTVAQDSEYVVSIWFPYLYYFPFAVFTLALARLASGTLEDLWALFLSGVVLVHGHASFGAMTVVMAIGGVVAYARAVRTDGPWLQRLRAEALRRRGTMVASGVILTLGLAPMVLNTVLNFPGEIPKYLGFGARSAGNPWGEALRFVGSYWGRNGVLGFGAAILLMLAVPGASPAVRREVRGVVWAVALASFAFALYAKTGIDFLEMRYTGFFYFAAVALAVTAAIVAVVSRLGRVEGPAVAIVFLAAIGAIAATLRPFADFSNEPEVPRLFATLRTVPSPPAVLDLDPARTEWKQVWGTVVGVAAHARRLGERPLCVAEGWHILFTQRFRCADADLRTGTRYLVTAKPVARFPGDGVLEMGGLRFVPLSPLPAPENARLPMNAGNLAFTARVLREGWSVPESGFTWSVGKRSVVRFAPPPGAGPLQAVLDIHAFLANAQSTQSVGVRVNGRDITTLAFSNADNRRERAIAIPEDIARQAVVEIELLVESPVSPAAAGAGPDPRELGVALVSLRVARQRP